MKRFHMIGWFAFLLAGVVLGGEWTERAQVTQPAGNLAFAVRWDPGAGLHLRVASPQSGRSIAFDLNRQAPQVHVTPDDAACRLAVDGAQFNPEALPTNTLDAVEVVVKFRQETWSVYVADRPVAVLSAPFATPVAVSHPPAALPPEGKRATRFQKTDDFVFHDDFLVPEGQEDELAAWDDQSGMWSLHSVLDDYQPKPPPKTRAARAANAKARAKPERKPMASMSPNFYSLTGSGTNALLLTGYDFYDAYSVEGAHQVGAGEGGLVFDYTATGGYHAFTVQPNDDDDRVRLSLWRTTSSNAANRTELAAATAEILEGQWVMLEVRTFQNRIQCFVDKTKVIDVPAELPVGGRFGVFANTDGRLLFDDVTARSNHDLDFRGIDDIRRHALVENGSFFPRRRFFSLFPPHERPYLEPPAAAVAQWLAVGSPAHGPHVFAAEFQPVESVGEFGLLAGYAGPGEPHYRLVCRRSETNETFRLETIATNGAASVLKTLVLPFKPVPDRPAESVRLMSDATADGELRFYRGRDLVLLYHGEHAVGGASGLYVGPDTRVRIADPEYEFERSDLYTDQFEKNTAYVTDRFMRHWSSPEGQWEDPTNNATWYKGDVFGRVAVHLPLIDGTAVHLGVGEGCTTGAWVVGVSTGRLALWTGAAYAASNEPVLAVSTGRVVGFVGPATNRMAGYTIHAEGHCLWVTSGDALAFQQSLPTPLQGRRIRITGFTTDELASSRVERYNVKDFLFKESLHDWTLNGGRWEIINRFQCDPRWSHMNGEASNEVAALWSKYVFRGDFCVEMYVGTRHGWYERCGDYNLTVMNRDTTPSQGYTVTCGGWDPEHSQLYTKLYRNGTVLTQSDDYCVPRLREGNHRKLRSVLVEAGRDVHGAWYYVKFRRSGHRLEYYFDNELVFACDDPNPIDMGSLGVWTYINSIMVARVKIAAESVAPKPLPFVAAPIAAPGVAAAPAAGPDDVPVDTDPGDWEAADPVSHARLTWHAPTNAAPFFAVTSVLGSGPLLARCSLPPISYTKIAGWRFEAKRSARGLFNFYYSIGRRNGVGVYVAERSYVHRLSGEDFARSAYTTAGHTDVPAGTEAGTDWQASGAWSPVAAWLPTVGYRSSAADTGLLVRVEGFGNLQPSYAAQGLTGNGPGEGYAVRGFAAIDSAPLPTNAVAATRIPISCGWSRRQPDTIDLTGEPGSLQRALAFADVTVGGETAKTRFTPPALLEVSVPRLSTCVTDLVVSLTGSDAITNVFRLAWRDAPLRTPPVLVQVEGPTPLFENFEPRNESALGASSRGLDGPDPAQGSFLTVFNTAYGQRLTYDFGQPLSLARYPILRFRYRGSAMARVSLSFLGSGTVHLSEPSGTARTVRGGRDLQLDGEWHTWQGLVCDAVNELPYQPGAMTIPRFRLASVEGSDQTGLCTEWDLDDFVAGPAASKGEQLAFTPHYFDFEGVTQVCFAVRSGTEDYQSLDVTQRAALAWRDIPNNQRTVPEIGALPDGLGELLLEARGVRGLASQVTVIPFLLHRERPEVSGVFEATTDPMGNGSCLALTVITAGGPPLDTEALAFRWNEKDVRVTNPLCSRLIPGVDRQKVVLNWPLVFRNQLNQTHDGEAFTLSAANIRDGASNAVPDIKLTRRIDYSRDRTPPTLLPTSYPSNILWTTAWEVNSEIRPFFTAIGNSTLTLVRTPGEAPWLAVQPSVATGGAVMAFSPQWRTKKYPCLAFRLRRPMLAPGDSNRIDVVLETETNAPIRIGLTPDAANSNRLSLPKPITWVSNEWASVTLDVASLLKDAGVTGKQAVVKSLSFVETGLPTNGLLNIQSVFAFAPWGPGDRVVMDAYDESGISGVSWETAQHSDGPALEPGSLAASAAGQGWVTMRMRDKAGNLSAPLYLPMGGRYAPPPVDDDP